MTDFFSFETISEAWITKVIVTIAIATIASFAARVFLDIGDRIARRATSKWEVALIKAARQPLQAVIWLIALTSAAQLIAEGNKFGPLAMSIPLRDVGIVLCVAWFLMRFITGYAQRVVESNRDMGVEIDLTTVDALSKLARLVVVISAALAVMQTFGLSVSGLLAAGGIGGLAVGFAAKDLLANFFGGLTIYLDRPFSVGDWIRSPDKEIEGTVEHISWRHTRIRAFNKNPIYVPNALFTTIVVENPSRMTHRRIHEIVGIRYDDIDALAPIVEDVRAMLRQHPKIDANQTIIVAFNTFSASSLDIMIYVYSQSIRWTEFHDVKQDVLLSVAKIIARHGAQIAYPTRTLIMDKSLNPEH